MRRAQRPPACLAPAQLLVGQQAAALLGCRRRLLLALLQHYLQARARSILPVQMILEYDHHRLAHLQLFVPGQEEVARLVCFAHRMHEEES